MLFWSLVNMYTFRLLFIELPFDFIVKKSPLFSGIVMTCNHNQNVCNIAPPEFQAACPVVII